mmetsp:Transcript_137868/g.384430  ORF Transcript_137868/g.384430 Transcript_137868/m.384430 type:complete len:227 (+) Transcript_137868:437-1117(+)
MTLAALPGSPLWRQTAEMRRASTAGPGHFPLGLWRSGGGVATTSASVARPSIALPILLNMGIGLIMKGLGAAATSTARGAPRQPQPRRLGLRLLPLQSWRPRRGVPPRMARQFRCPTTVPMATPLGGRAGPLPNSASVASMEAGDASRPRRRLFYCMIATRGTHVGRINGPTARSLGVASTEDGGAHMRRCLSGRRHQHWLCQQKRRRRRQAPLCHRHLQQSHQHI